MLGFGEVHRTDLALYCFHILKIWTILCLLRFQKKVRDYYVPRNSILMFAKFEKLKSSVLASVGFNCRLLLQSMLFLCCTIWVMVGSQNRLNVEIYRKAVSNLGYDQSPNPPIISLPSIRVPNLTWYSWSLGTVNDEMVRELPEGWNYVTRKKAFPVSQYERDR